MRYTPDWTDYDCLYARETCHLAEMDPAHLVLDLQLESDGRADAKNGSSSATGLCQWMADDNDLYFGHTRAAFVALGVTGQLPYLRQRFVARRGKVFSRGRVYGVITAPAAVDLLLDEDEPIYALKGKTRFSRTPDGHDTQRSYLANLTWDPLRVGFSSLRTMGLAARAHLTMTPRYLELHERIVGEPCDLEDYREPMTWAARFAIASMADLAEWQRERGLEPDGVAGPMTLARMVVERELQLAEEDRSDALPPALPGKPWSAYEDLVASWPRRDYLDVEA